MNTGKKSWRAFSDEKRKRKAERIEKKLEKSLTKQQKVQKPEKTDHPEKRVKQSCSIAIPGSILENAQTEELRAYLAGQIARAACIYKISEIVVFDDSGGKERPSKFCLQFARLLQYLECPQYLRKNFFPIHKDLQFIGVLNPLDAPHHLRQNEESEYREGISTEKPTKGAGCYVNVGLGRDVKVGEKLEPGLRCTVRLFRKEGAKKLYGDVVSPDEPYRVRDLYWGYTVRVAHSLSEVLTKSPHPDGYDVTIGTSDKGKSIDDYESKEFKDFSRVLVVFGGLKGLEAALESDEIPAEHPSLLFDHYVNTCPNQGSRTIRTEEAVLITLAELRRLLQ